MSLSKPIKILIGSLTALLVLLPFILTFGSILLVPALMIGMQQSARSDTIGLIIVTFWFFTMLFSMTMVFLNLAMQIVYIVLILKDKTLTDTARILYTLGAIYFHFVAIPLYFVLRVWKAEEPGKALAVSE